LAIILKVIASGNRIKMETFATLLTETKKIYLENYNWYYMPVSLHKILIHGPAIITSFFVPIGILSEEALECRHKDFRRIREHNTRKTSRLNTNKDIMMALLQTSDPGIAMYRKKTSNNRKFSKDVEAYIETDENNDNSLSRSSSNEETSSSDSE
jgi:hypothetical protein